MISRRNFFSIVTLMAVLFFLCMGTNNLKDWWNDYTVNTYTETAENYPSRIHLYIPGNDTSEEAAQDGTDHDGGGNLYASRDMVVLIGDGEGIYGRAVREWVMYSRRKMTEYATLSAYAGAEEDAGWPEMLIIDSKCVDWGEPGETDFLAACVEQGTHLVFSSLPDVSVIEDNDRVRNLLGIRKVKARETAAAGLHLYEGFLLGGESIYLPEEGEKEAGKEGEIVFPGETNGVGTPVFPWYLLSSGTKVYMKGIPGDPAVDTEDYPALIWRKSFGTAYVFAVNGGYMEGIEAIGLLSAMSAEMYSYEIYPVINAQNMVLAGYPGLADENREGMDRFYGWSLNDVFQEVLWPNISTVLNRYEYKATCMLTPQFDYTDAAFPDPEQLAYFLKIFREASAEVGLSGLCVSDTPVGQKLEEDGRFVMDAVGGYEFASFYAGNLSGDEIETALQSDVLSSVMTVVRNYGEGDTQIIQLLSEHVTGQMAFDIGFEYNYKGDFLVKCLETALGYLNVSFDMERVAYPDGKEDAWENISPHFGTTVAAIGETFREFDRTTVSECDMRIRQFFAMDYRDSRKGDRIRIQISEGAGSGWFILRTHNETIGELEGGSWRRLEKDAYLIEAQGGEVIITMEPADARFYK